MYTTNTTNVVPMLLVVISGLKLVGGLQDTWFAGYLATTLAMAITGIGYPDGLLSGCE